MKWTEVWHAPFWYDGYGYVFDPFYILLDILADNSLDNLQDRDILLDKP